ncbi:hypothetical protein FB451DRAFT_1406877 [Mycena latifolia]|nr:hypothetical protein FB451DRAFT_1406877 [Mycena latifolia]
MPTGEYTPLLDCPWEDICVDTGSIDTPKVSTALPEQTTAKPSAWKDQEDEEEDLQGNPEDHRGREKGRSGVSYVAGQIPPAFTTGPSLATRPLSRTASMASEVADTPTPSDSPADDGDATPIFLATHKEVSKVLHLAGPPTTKAGTKEKPEPAAAGSARANGNIIRLGGKMIALEAKLEGGILAVKNDVRDLKSKIQNVNAGKIEERFGVLEGVVRTSLEGFDAKLAAGGAGVSSDSRVSLHTAQIARLTDDLETTQRRVGRLADSFTDAEGFPIPGLFATKGDVNALYGSVQEGFDGLDEMVVDKVQESLAPLLKRLDDAADQLAKFDARIARVEKKAEENQRGVLGVRESIASTQGELAKFMMRSTPASTTIVTAPAAPAATTPPAATAPPAANYAINVSGKKHKRKASVELIAPPAKRSAGKPDKAAYHHWVRVGPVNPDTKHSAPTIFWKLAETAMPSYSLPAVYIERVAREPSVIAVGFSTANDANSFVGAWIGASTTMPLALRGISATHVAVASSSNATDTISFLTGN